MALSDAPASIPDGFAPHSRHSPLTTPWQPLYARPDGHHVQLGLWVREAHCNGRGFAHGGLISALADNAMGLSAVAAARAAASAAGHTPPAGAVTVSLVLDFMASASIGQWLEFRPVVLRHGRTLAFTECHVLADGELAARASATFRLG